MFDFDEFYDPPLISEHESAQQLQLIPFELDPKNVVHRRLKYLKSKHDDERKKGNFEMAQFYRGQITWLVDKLEPAITN